MDHQAEFASFGRRFARRPGFVIGAFVALCLAAFLVTIPLPRVDNQLVGSDGIGYYVYLPSYWLDHDLDFTNEYAYFFAYTPDTEVGFHTQRTVVGVPPNQWAVGPALLWSPFFLLAHLVFHAINGLGAQLPVDGLSQAYQAVVLASSILYAGLGLWFIYRFVCSFAVNSAALFGTIFVAMSGNLVYYMTAEPSMSHALSVFASGLFFFTWAKRRERWGITTAIYLGLIGGLMALVRPQDGIFLVLPFLDQLVDVFQAAPNKRAAAIGRWVLSGLAAAAAALAVFSLQLSAWMAIYGDLLHSGYFQGGGGFNWLQPQLLNVLVSAQRGLFVWHPIYLVGLAGLIATFQRDHTMAILGWLGFALQWYLTSSWGDWVQGDAFGGRMLIVCTPIIALGVASLIEWVVERWSWAIVLGVASLLVIWNLLLFIEYRFYLVGLGRLPTWYDVTVGRFTIPLELLWRVVKQER